MKKLLLLIIFSKAISKTDDTTTPVAKIVYYYQNYITKQAEEYDVPIEQIEIALISYAALGITLNLIDYGAYNNDILKCYENP